MAWARERSRRAAGAAEDSRSRAKDKGFPWRRLLFGALVAYLALTVAQVWAEGRREGAAPAEAIVVLGAAQWNGRPSPVLRARLDHAIALYHAGYAPLLITTGGHGRDPRFSEAGVGAEYAIARGVPREAILSEEIGRSTWSSMVEVERLTREQGVGRLIVVSDPFHIARIRAMAGRLGLETVGSPTRSSPISRNALVETRYVLAEITGLTLLRLGLQR